MCYIINRYVFGKRFEECRLETLSERRSLYKAVVILAVGATLALAVIILSPFFHESLIEAVFYGIILAAGVVSASLISYRLLSESERHKTAQTEQIISITNQTLHHLKHGLTEESAVKVAKILAEQSDAAAVAITDKNTILACEGAGEKGFVACGPVITPITKRAMDTDQVTVMKTSDEIGCPNKDCYLKCGIIAPLHFKNKVAGTLKFYYDSNDMLTRSRIAFAKGLATLLSTQLELSEIEYQTTLAYRAQLKALQAQINPHFLFNTLNTIAMFCRTKPGEARRLLLEFSTFFRKSLERTEDFIALKEEMDYVDQYLLFETARFGDNIRVVKNISGDSLHVKLPALTLQPLVENAVRHGFPTSNRPLVVTINGYTENDILYINIKDNGMGISKKDLNNIFKPGYGKGTGLGLSNVNDRLSGIYENDYRISVSSTPGRGTTVSIQIPARRKERLLSAVKSANN